MTTPTLNSVHADLSDRIELSEYLHIVRRRWVSVLVPLVLIASLAAFMNLRADSSYRATAQVLLNANEANELIQDQLRNAGLANRDVENEISFAKSDTVDGLVIEALGTNGLPGGMSVRGGNSSDVLIFSASATDPDVAARRANAWANAYVEAKQIQATASTRGLIDTFRSRLDALESDRATEREILDGLEDDLAFATSEARRTDLQRQIDRESRRIAFKLSLIDAEVAAIAQGITELEINGTLAAIGNVRVIQVAAPPETTLNTPLWQALIVGLVAGSLVGVGAAFLRHNLDSAIKSAEDVTRTCGLPVVGSIPRPDRSSKGLNLDYALESAPGSPQAEGYLEVRAALQFLFLNQDVKSVLITSPSPSEGKTTSVANIALAMSLIGKDTLAVDVDFRRPRLHDVYSVEREPGISNHILSDTPLPHLVHSVDWASDKLSLLTAGAIPPRPADLVGNSMFLDTLLKLEKEVDLVVLDGPPVLPVADSQTLARHADATVLCVKAGSTKRPELQAAVAKLNQAGAHIIGVVLVGAGKASSYKHYAYSQD